MSEQLVMMFPSAIEARRSGLRVGRRLGETLREKYLAVLRANPAGVTDHQAAALLGVLSTTVGARRQELIEADPEHPCIVAVGRVRVGDRSRAVWRMA